jgi:hypothetical protein
MMRVAENPNWAGFYPENDATPTHGDGDRILSGGMVLFLEATPLHGGSFCCTTARAAE